MRLHLQQIVQRAASEQPAPGVRPLGLGRWTRRAGSANTLVMLACFVFGGALLAALGMRFPSEASRWVDNQAEIRKLQELNADLKKFQEERELRLKRFNENYLDQELEIIRQYHLYKPGDSLFMLPSTKPEATDAAPALPPVPTPATP